MVAQSVRAEGRQQTNPLRSSRSREYSMKSLKNIAGRGARTVGRLALAHILAQSAVQAAISCTSALRPGGTIHLASYDQGNSSK